MNKIYIGIGGVCGLLTSFFLYYYLNNELYHSKQHNLLYRVSSVSVLFVSVLFAIIAAKKLNGNRISFMRCMFTGFVISLISGLVNFGFFTGIYFAKPEILNKAEQVSISQYLSMPENKDKSEKELRDVKRQIHSQFTPGGSLLPTVFASFATCMIAAIFISAFVYTRSYPQ
ncbi:MAG: DUF4199 domain-containing protein [Flavobacteriales bacterium]|nr:DUF4199 domain-containing protein [Flavobacteriales bacterium]